MVEEKTVTVTNISEYIAAVKDATDYPGIYVFRGQSDKAWPLRSAAARRILKALGKENENEVKEFNHFFLLYHGNDLIKAAKKHGYHREDGRELKDLEVLAKLQHHGAATCLMDFTKNSLFALWFACQDEKNDGAVFIINSNDPSNISEFTHDDLEKSFEDILKFNTRDKKKNKPLKDAPALKDKEMPEKENTRNQPLLWYWEPESFDPRILQQDSAFLFGPPLVPKELIELKIIIRENEKKEILKKLIDMFHINAETLFNDLIGFAGANSSHSPLKEYGIKRIPSEESGDAGQYFIMGNHHFQQGQYEEAIKDYDEAIRLNPNDAKAYYNRGNAKYYLKKYKKAIEDYNKAILLNPKDAAAYNNRGTAKNRLGQYKEAIKDFDKAIQLNPNDSYAYNNRGAAKYKLERHKEAIEDYDEAIRLNPKYAFAYNNRGNTKKELGRNEEAEEDFKKYRQLTEEKPK